MILYYKFLPFFAGAIVYYNSVLGSGYGPIVYVYVACEGHEDSFTECYKRTLLEYYWLSCNTDTVGVLCVDGENTIINLSSFLPFSTCT